MKAITVLLAEDEPTVRRELRALLENEKDIEVIGEAGNGHRAVTFASTLCPDVVVMDISMPQLDGLVATRRIRATTASTKILVLSVHRDREYVERAAALGASGYVFKDAAARILPDAIRAVKRGTEYFPL